MHWNDVRHHYAYQRTNRHDAHRNGACTSKLAFRLQFRDSCMSATSAQASCCCSSLCRRLTSLACILLCSLRSLRFLWTVLGVLDFTNCTRLSVTLCILCPANDCCRAFAVDRNALSGSLPLGLSRLTLLECVLQVLRTKFCAFKSRLHFPCARCAVSL